MKMHASTMYDMSYWNKYACDNESRYSKRFATFLSDTLDSLQCSSVLEVGCGTGIDLRAMHKDVLVNGVDLNQYALKIAKGQYPSGSFSRCTVTQLPFQDSSIDFVFSHGLLSCLDDDALSTTMSEMYRVARRYIMTCELIGQDGDVIDGPFRNRDIQGRWLQYGLEPIKTTTVQQDAYLVPTTLQLFKMMVKVTD